MDALAKRLKRISATKDAVCADAKGFHHCVPFQDVKQHNNLYIGVKFADLTKQTAAGEFLICDSTDEGYLKPSFDEGACSRSLGVTAATAWKRLLRCNASASRRQLMLTTSATATLIRGSKFSSETKVLKHKCTG